MGTIAFTAWAPAALLGLPLAALFALAPPRASRARIVAALTGLASVMLVAWPGGGMLEGVVRAYVVLVTAAFVGGVVLAPTGALRQAARATACGGAVALALAFVQAGPTAGSQLVWEATREASRAMRLAVELVPPAFTVYEPAVRLASTTLPGVLVLQGLAGLALAWQWHTRLAERPLGPPLAPFRQFRFSDHCVWAVVAALAVWVTPVLAALKPAALNVAVVLGALYLLRGAAIAAAFAQAFGVSTGALIVAVAVGAVLAAPLLLALWMLGVTDTWFEFRRRLAAGRLNVQ